MKKINRCLITGGAGFIGQAISAELKRRGDTVIILDKECVDNPLDGVYRGDILDRNILNSLSKNIDEIYHLAALLGTSELMSMPFDGVETNIKGTVDVLEVSTLNKISKFFYPGMPKVWLNMYSITKSSAEDICRMYQKYFGVKIRILRWLNAYGPGQHIYPIRKVIPIFIIQALHNLPIEIWGNGNQNVDLLYVEDIAKWTVDFMRTETVPDFTIEIGVHHTCTVNELAAMIIKYTESDSSIIHFQMRKGEDANVTVPRIKNIYDTLNIETNPTPLDTGLKKTIDYYRSLDPSIHNQAIQYYYGCGIISNMSKLITKEARMQGKRKDE